MALPLDFRRSRPPQAQPQGISRAEPLASWMSSNSDLFDQIFRPESLNDLFGSEFEKLEGAPARADFAIPVLQRLTKLWMRGRPLNEIQASLGTANETASMPENLWSA